MQSDLGYDKKIKSTAYGTQICEGMILALKYVLDFAQPVQRKITFWLVVEAVLRWRSRAARRRRCRLAALPIERASETRENGIAASLPPSTAALGRDFLPSYHPSSVSQGFRLHCPMKYRIHTLYF